MSQKWLQKFDLKLYNIAYDEDSLNLLYKRNNEKMGTKKRNKKIIDQYRDFLHRFFSFWEVPENEKIFTRSELQKWWENAPKKIGKWEEKIGGIIKPPASLNLDKIGELGASVERRLNAGAEGGEDKIKNAREKLSAVYDGTWDDKKLKGSKSGEDTANSVESQIAEIEDKSNIGLALNLLKKTNNESEGKVAIKDRTVEGNISAAAEAEEPTDLELIPIAEAAKSSVYSREYLSSSIRSGRLRAKKIDGVWHTTEEWLGEFTRESQARKDKYREQLSKKLKGEEEEILIENGQEELATPKLPLIYWPAFNARVLKPVFASLVLLFFVAVANYSKVDIANAHDLVLREALIVYNKALDGLSGSGAAVNSHFAGAIHGLKAGKDTISNLNTNIFYRNKVNEREKETGLTFRGSDEGRQQAAEASDRTGLVAGEQRAKVEIGQNSNSSGQVLAATDLKAAVGDLDVSMYLLGPDAKEIANGEYEVRFSLYSLDRTETDPYPSDADQASRVWEETQTVQVENGLLKTYLGAANPIPQNFNFASSVYYLGIRVSQDPEMTPRKRIGAVPLARTAMNIAGQTIGNAQGNIPLSNGTINVNLNADTLDGRQASYFQVAGNYQPAGTYDNYVSWKLQSNSTDVGQKINSNKGAIFTGANGIITTRALNTLTISPTYGSADNTIAQGSTPITVNTTGNLQGGGTGTAGGGISLEISTIDNPTFNTVYLSTLDLGTNTIADGNMNGNWNFNGGVVSGIDALTATTGNFTTANITLGNITTADFGTNTITDENFTGDWNFNAGNLSNIATATVTGNFNLTASSNLVFGGTTSLGESSGPLDSGAFLVGVADEFANSNSTNVQAVLNDLDAAIAGGGPGALWTLAGGTVFPTDAANDFAVGGATLAASIFGIDESLGNFYFGYDNSASPTFLFESANASAGTFGFNDNDAFYFSGANVGINEINPLYGLDVNGTLRATGNFDAQNGIDVTGASLTVGGANFSVDVANGNVTANGDFQFTGDQSITGTGTITINPTGNLYFQSASYYMDEAGNLTIAKAITPEVEYSGNITIDANSAAGTTTVTVTNQDGAQVANLQIEGDIDVQGGKITLASGETIDAETADTVKITSGGDVMTILGDAAGAKIFAIYDSTGANEVGHIDSDGNIQFDGTATFADKLTVQSNGASITGNVVIVGDIDATTGTIATLDGTSASFTTGGFTTANITTGNITTIDLGVNTITDANMTGNWNMNAGNLTNITALTTGTANVTTLDLGTNTITDGNLTGGWNFNSAALTGVSSIDTINTSSTALTFTGTAPTISISTAATAINLEAGTTGEINIGSVSSGNVNIAAEGSGDVILAGGSLSTGCTIDNATGNLDCSGNITGSSSGTVGFWTRTATNLTPATAGDDIYLGANSLLGAGYDPATFSAGTVASFNGNVGIGTTSPTYKLYVDSGNSASSSIYTTGKIYAVGNVTSAIGLVSGLWTNSSSADFAIKQAVAGYKFYIKDNVGAAQFTVVNDTGYVGIGTTNPLALLSVGATSQFRVSSAGAVTGGTYNGVTITTGTGTLTLNDKTLNLSNSLTLSGADGKTINFGTNNLTFSTSGDYTLTIPATGTAALGTGTNGYVAVWNGTNSLTSQQYLNVAQGGTGAGTFSSNYLLKGNGTSALSSSVIYDDGTNVGIGTTATGTYKLNVAGDINATNYYANGNPISPLTAGTITGQTLYWDGAAWTANTNLFNNNTNVGIGTTLPSQLFQVNNSGTSAFVVTSGGNVGIGTTSPGANLALQGASGQIANLFTVASSTGTSLMSMTPGGVLRLGPGTSPLVTGYELAQFDDTDGSKSNWAFRVASNGFAMMDFATSAGTLTSPTVSGSSGSYGGLRFKGYSGSAFVETAKIEITKDGTPSASSMPSAIIFKVTAVNSIVDTEAMRISNNSRLGIGTTNPLALLSVGATSQFQVSTTGNVTAGTYNGVTISGNGTLATGAGSYTLTVPATGTAALGTGTNGYVAVWNGTNSLTSQQYLNVAQGGTGAGT
ncbi:MAG: hypothetical protein WC858_02780, partial [Parcubacteria group bacterium]